MQPVVGPLLQERAVQLNALRVLQTMLAEVELVVLKADHGGGHGPGGPRVRRRWAALVDADDDGC